MVASTEDKKTSRGLPQGSVLSPILFNIYFANLHKFVRKYANTDVLQYADDSTCIIISHKEIEKVYEITNAYLCDFINIIQERNHLNFDKCQILDFSNCTKNLKITMNDIDC